MNPIVSRSRAQAFAALLEATPGLHPGLTLRTVDGTPGTASPTAVPGLTPALAPAAVLALRLQALGASVATPSTPRPEFRTALRTRLLAVAAVQGIGVPVADAAVATASARPLAVTPAWAQGRRTQRGLGLAAGAMASVVALAGVAVAGSRSLPGDPLYAAKRAVEDVQLRFADGDVERGTVHLEQAETRLREVRALVDGRDELRASALTPTLAAGRVDAFEAAGGSLSRRVNQALTDMDAATTRGRDLLESAFRTTGEVEPLRVLATFAQRQSRALERALPSLPTLARARAQESLTFVTAVAQQTELKIALGTCGDQCDPTQGAPALPTASPEPAPSASSTTGGTDVLPTSEPDCRCQPVPTPQPQPQPSESETSSPSPSPSPTGSASPSPTQEPSEEPTSILPTELPLPLPEPLPTTIPLPPIVLPPDLGIPGIPGIPGL